MGCLACRPLKYCESRESRPKKQSEASLESKQSENKFAGLAATSKESMFRMKEPKGVIETPFNDPRFTSSAVIYFNNVKKNIKLNPFFNAMEQNCSVYFTYFPDMAVEKKQGDLFITTTEHLYQQLSSKELLEKIEKSTAFQRHLKVTTKLLHSLLSLAVTGDICTADACLQRIGAIHAELGIPAKHVYSYLESFYVCLEQTIGPDKNVFRSWHILIRYIVFMIVKGMNEHYQKIRFVYWSAEHHGRCSVARPTLLGIDPDSWMSLRNMAHTVEAMQD